MKYINLTANLIRFIDRNNQVYEVPPSGVVASVHVEHSGDLVKHDVQVTTIAVAGIMLTDNRVDPPVQQLLEKEPDTEVVYLVDPMVLVTTLQTHPRFDRNFATPNYQDPVTNDKGEVVAARSLTMV